MSKREQLQRYLKQMNDGLIAHAKEQLKGIMSDNYHPNLDGPAEPVGLAMKEPPMPYTYPVFKHMSDNHGLTLLDSEIDEIIHVCRPFVLHNVKHCIHCGVQLVRHIESHGVCKTCERAENNDSATPVADPK